MALPSLQEPFNTLELHVVETLLAGHNARRPDLPYPASQSDMMAAVRAMLRMFEVKRLPIARELPIEHD